MTNKEATEIMEAIIHILKFDDYSDEVEEAIHMAINALTAQPEQSSEIQDILDYLDTVLHPIISPENWNVYSELHDMISTLPSAQPETHEKRTETHACDCISRSIAVEAVQKIAHIATLPDGDDAIRKRAVKYVLLHLPSAQPEIVRCRDCKHIIEHKHYGDLGESAYTCEGNMVGWILPDDFCSYAERRDDG